MQKQVDGLLRAIATRGALLPRRSNRVDMQRTSHVIAYSGGVDSSLAAALVLKVFPTTTAACLGVSPSLAAAQLSQARRVAQEIGIPLWECETQEAQHPQYVENTGKSCYYCKTTLYSTIQQVTVYASHRAAKDGAGVGSSESELTIYNGTNADDMEDPTRVGLVAAKEFDVVSPLRSLTKPHVGEMAKYLGLSNWNAAASPCLRSRLAFGVEATQHHLKQVEQAEAFLRELLQLETDANLRVRFLTGQRAAVEIDNGVLPHAIESGETITSELQRIGFKDVDIRAFRSGSLSGYTPPVQVAHTSPSTLSRA